MATPPEATAAPTNPEPTPAYPAVPMVLPPARPANVIEALAAVMSDLPGIGKTERSEQGYQYRGIEAITREAQPLLGKYGVVFVPRVEHREVKAITINGKPWTEDQATVSYRVYGPGGLQDYIDVGPLVALGRDNSDKGMNKCMTQAYKYALLQVLCVGDHKDDADGDVAREADPPPPPKPDMDPDVERRLLLRQRIDKARPLHREMLREFCKEHGIPPMTKEMTDDQVDAVQAALDGYTLADEREAATEPATAPGEAPAGPQAALVPDPPGDAPGADMDPCTQWGACVLGAGHEGACRDVAGNYPPADPAHRTEVVGVVVQWDKPTVVTALTERGLPTGGRIEVLQGRLADALVAEGWHPTTEPEQEQPG